MTDFLAARPINDSKRKYDLEMPQPRTNQAKQRHINVDATSTSHQRRKDVALTSCAILELMARKRHKIVTVTRQQLRNTAKVKQPALSSSPR